MGQSITDYNYKKPHNGYQILDKSKIFGSMWIFRHVQHEERQILFITKKKVEKGILLIQLIKFI